MRLDDPITAIKGIGEKASQLYAKLGIYNIADLLEHYPNRYDKYEAIIPIALIEEGKMVTFQGCLQRNPTSRKVRNLQITSCRIYDGTDNVQVSWFNMPFLAKQLKMGTHYIFRGKAIRKNGFLSIEQPVLLSKQEYTNKLGVMQPVYGLTAGLTNHAVSKATKFMFSEVELPKDYLPKEIRDEYDLMELKKALKSIHYPLNQEVMLEARKRIVFNEFLLFSLAVTRMKMSNGLSVNCCPMVEVNACQQLIQSLPYELTEAQKKVWDEIRTDMMGKKTMNRLVQGDVGSGKTIIAAIALCMAAKNNYQGTLMVPTEVLAKQHYESLLEVLSPMGIRIALLVGSMKAKEKREALEAIKSHQVDIIVGTHALIQEKVEYDNLGLVITDEQHRFGVEQRKTLTNKGNAPHVLVMSATPIPRTLAIILYGDLDLSVIDQLPANRLPIKNCVVNTSYRNTAYRFIEKEVMAGRQAYVICPMVEESEAIEAENVIEYTEKLREALSPSITVEYLHGKMKGAEKNEIMERFSSGITSILVSTTVIEVGVNVPNSTVMMIENAERFGLAQLHQLRGRVGRGKYQSYCILISGNSSKETTKRLEILNQSNDGFYIAEQDLKLRGPGDLFGIRQSGVMEFKIADVFQDAKILKQAAKVAKQYLDQDEKLLKKNPYLLEKIDQYSKDVLL